jgi:hypothetical protein
LNAISVVVLSAAMDHPSNEGIDSVKTNWSERVSAVVMVARPAQRDRTCRVAVPEADTSRRAPLFLAMAINDFSSASGYDQNFRVGGLPHPVV